MYIYVYIYIIYIIYIYIICIYFLKLKSNNARRTTIELRIIKSFYES